MVLSQHFGAVPGVLLPETGGLGTIGYTVIGAVALGLAGFGGMVVYNRRKLRRQRRWYM